MMANEPDIAVVGVLGRLLEEARAGKIVGLALVASHGDPQEIEVMGDVGTGIAPSADTDLAVETVIVGDVNSVGVWRDATDLPRRVHQRASEQSGACVNGEERTSVAHTQEPYDWNDAAAAVALDVRMDLVEAAHDLIVTRHLAAEAYATGRVAMAKLFEAFRRAEGTETDEQLAALRGLLAKLEQDMATARALFGAGDLPKRETGQDVESLHGFLDGQHIGHRAMSLGHRIRQAIRDRDDHATGVRAQLSVLDTAREALMRSGSPDELLPAAREELLPAAREATAWNQPDEVA